MIRTASSCCVFPALIAVMTLTLTACGSSSRPSDVPGWPADRQAYGADTSEAAVRAFLDAAAAYDYPGMWAVFGTKDGAAIERFGVKDIEARMIVLSRLLRNNGYEMHVENLASYGPNRVRYIVELRGTRKGNVALPVLTVPDGSNRWFVEQLDVNRITTGSSR